MKFDYPEMTTLPVNGMRFYETPSGQFYPSITTVLGNTISEEKAKSLESWRTSLGSNEADRIIAKAAASGTNVHLLAERYLKKEKLIQDSDNFSNEDIKRFNAIKLKLNKVQEVWGQEVPLCSHLLQIAGRCDLIGVYNNKASIIDYKTSRRVKKSNEIDDYRLQLTAYSIMHNETYNTNIIDGVIIMSSESGFPQEFHVNLLEYYDILEERVNNFYRNLKL